MSLLALQLTGNIGVKGCRSVIFAFYAVAMGGILDALFKSSLCWN